MIMSNILEHTYAKSFDRVNRRFIIVIHKRNYTDLNVIVNNSTFTRSKF